jgi:DnaJ-class molecular chaperone
MLTIPCYVCEGKGIDNGKMIAEGFYPDVNTYYREPQTCENCDGTGEITEPHSKYF